MANIDVARKSPLGAANRAGFQFGKFGGKTSDPVTCVYPRCSPPAAKLHCCVRYRTDAGVSGFVQLVIAVRSWAFTGGSKVVAPAPETVARHDG
jgi:hypothetical protein